MTILEAKRKTRLAVWQQHIQSSGLTVRAWCTQNGCSEKSYYYWLRLVRERMLEQAEGSTLMTMRVREAAHAMPVYLHRHIPERLLRKSPMMPQQESENQRCAVRQTQALAVLGQA